MKVTERSNLLDLMRWLSALFVVLGHVRSVLFIDYTLYPTTNPIYKFIYFITGFGHEAVIIFFVLSGYLICESIIKQYQSNKFNIKRYAINRTSRIYIVLIPALFFTIFFDTLGASIDKTGLYLSDSSILSLKENPLSRLTILHFLASAGMLQNIFLPTFGSNGPLWSLNYEFWYYMVIPFILGIYYSKKNALILFVYLICIIAFVYLIPFIMIKYGIIWICGIIPCYFNFHYKTLKYLSLILFISFLISARLYNMGFCTDLLIAISAGLFISNCDNTKISEYKNYNHLLASFSYSLYLLHYPFILCLLAIVNELFTASIKTKMNIGSLSIYSVCIFLTYLFSYLIANFTESKTNKLRMILNR